MVAHSVRVSQACEAISRTICSTDDDEIARTASEYGAEVPFKRPAAMAADTSTDADYALHAVEWLRDNEGWTPDILVILWPTCPLRSAQQVAEAVDILEGDPDADSVVSVVNPAKSPYKMWRRTTSKYLVPLLTSEVFEQFAGPRQRLPEVLAPNGYVHGVRTSTLLRTKSVLGLRVLPYKMDAAECVDIDTEEDLAKAESLLRRRRTDTINS